MALRVNQIASEMVVAPYSAKKLREAVSDFQRLTFDPEEIRHVRGRLRSAECAS